MIEIIPNVHPIFVHFTVALCSTAVGFYALSYIANHLKFAPKVFTVEFEVVARWCLWAAAIISIFTVWAGLHAYNTVNHDAPSHAAMTDHRNWAVPTAATIILIAIWSAWRYYKRRTLTITFIIALLIVQGLLLSTAWRGAELVFRYGLGVMSLPKAKGEGHNHHHAESKESAMDHTNMPTMENHEEHTHSHQD